MIFSVKQSSGQPIYAQIVQQIRLAVEMGVLRPGDPLPGIRTLAEQLVVSPNTIVKAYSELETSGIVSLRQGSGAYIAKSPRTRSQTERLRAAQERVKLLVQSLQDDRFSDDEIQRFFEAELFYPQLKS